MDQLHRRILVKLSIFSVETTHGHGVQFGKGTLPAVFCFDDAGDEWDCCCISNTGKYNGIEEFVNINEWGEYKELKIKKEVLESEPELPEDVFYEEALMKDFMKSVKEYWPESSEYEEADEDARNSGMIFPEDFVYFKNVEVLRLKTCEWDVHSLMFLEELPNLKILEIGEVRLSDLEGIEKLIGLEKLVIWAN